MSHMSAYMRRVRRRDGRDLQLLDGGLRLAGHREYGSGHLDQDRLQRPERGVANPTSSSDTSTTTGTASGSVAITSNSDGSLASTTPSRRPSQ
jgi:hypothetical protein